MGAIDAAELLLFFIALRTTSVAIGMFLVVILILSIVLAFPAPLYRWVVGTPAIWAVAVVATVAPV
ncbi:MAG: hypothetical protein HGA86_06805, partial [Anaerolineaceae bacterium]|nr:hypothetical protein [Anaerolineaceae bacterium]